MAINNQIIGGNFMDPSGAPLANGYLILQLSQDEQSYIPSEIGAGRKIRVDLDSTGNLPSSPPVYVFANDALNPTNSWYSVSAYTADGQRVWGPNTVQILSSPSPFNISNWVPNSITSGSAPAPIPTLETNGVKNGSQTLLNLVAGNGVAITDDGEGDITIAASGGGSGSLSGTLTNAFPHSSPGSLNVSTEGTKDWFVPRSTTAYASFDGWMKEDLSTDTCGSLRKGFAAIWDDIGPVQGVADERVGFPTQKPLKLLERIIEISSEPGDVVLDAFCGCGTALVAAQNAGRQWIGIDISPTACRVMAKRLRDCCGLTESEKLWRIGRGFVVRDLPWTEQQLRKLPPFEFENWAVIAVGGTPNRSQVGDMGIDGRIYPVSAIPKGRGREDQFAFMDEWYPIQVKQSEKIGRPDVDSFEAVMMRENRDKGFMVGFDFTLDAEKEINRFNSKTGKRIVPQRVKDLLEDESVAQRIPPSPVKASTGRLRRAATGA